MGDKKTINPNAFTCEVMDLDGINHTLTGRVVPRKDLGEFNRSMFTEAIAVPLDEQLAFQASYLFEKPADFWDNFDVRVLTRAVSVFLADMRNPQG